MPVPPPTWPFTLDESAPPALAAFLARASLTWLPVSAARRELGLATVVAVISTSGGGRVVPCSPAEAQQLVPGADLDEPPPAGAVWCVALLPGASGRWALRHALGPQRRPRLEVVRGGTGDEGEGDGAASGDPVDE